MSLIKLHKDNEVPIWKKVIYFFPIQLLVLHFKRNHLLLFFWLLLYLYVNNAIGSKYGISYLFLAPEYLGNVDGFSFAILGFALGGFIMAFNIYSYILHANEFPFLATLSRPFLKFCYNNLMIPLFFYFLICYKSYFFQVNQELVSSVTAFVNLLAFTAGLIIFLIITFSFFLYFNKNVFALSGKDENYFESLKKDKVKESTFVKETAWYKRMSRVRKSQVLTYIYSPVSIRLARDTDHYDAKLLKEVFAQNHINASIFEFTLIISFLVLGIFRDVEWMNIPAAASILLLFTLFLLIFSAIYSWIKGWTLTLLIGGFLLFNFIANYTDSLKFKNYAYGIDYSTSAEYTWENLNQLNTNVAYRDSSFQHGKLMLDNWASKNRKLYNTKPKLILLNISGGGLRASMWTMEILSYLDSVSNGKFFNQTHLITGASGGMIGATYFRELYLQSKTDSTIDLTDNKYTTQLSEDLLNPLTFGIATTDLLFRYQKVHDGNYSYTKDRGYSFEQKLIKNLDGTFEDKRIYDYWEDEFYSNIPMIIYSPSVVNDGRRMLVSPQPIGYLTYHSDTLFTNGYNSMENIEFSKLFERNDPFNLKVTSAMRMSATFPYILPMVTMPTEPPVELMDAGIRDNYGLKTSLNFLDVYSDWIEKNTSGVIIVQIRDKQKYFEVENSSNGMVIQRLFAPLGSFYSNTTKVHDYTNDQLLQLMMNETDFPIESLTFYMEQNKGKHISMSWHLTSLDKKNILQAVNESDNQKATLRLLELLNQ
ncbi:MAG: patatin-like phospholipase family protein [Flavobacteriales bacterium]|nr:patatin-like phospholipase family protein [Flavobacteriales bacterium]MCB9198503.1 patatin-like phospholipase family protein [Flavobacteriales bacterium]